MVFNDKFDYPFPIMIDSKPQSSQALSSQSVFNITLAKLKSPQTMLFNMDVLKK